MKIMKTIKRLITVGIITFMIISTLACYVLENNYRDNEESVVSNSIKVAGLLYTTATEDPFMEKVRKNLEYIQAENSDKVEFTFYYAIRNQDIQNQTLDMVLEQGIDLLIIKLADITQSESVINKIKQTNTPVVFFNREPVSLTPIKSYNKAIYIGTDGTEAGILQGEILVKEWDTKREIIDKNKDNVLQYIMLTGDKYNIEAIERTKYSVDTIEKAGIKTEELALRVCDYDEEEARRAMQNLLYKYGDKIEAVIANNDAMAIGAIKALQEFGYNKGVGQRTIPVIGVDAIEKAKDLISKGIMTGTVIQDDYEMAKAIYLTGMNLVSRKDPVEGTPYKFDKTGVAIRIPYKEYKES